MPRRGREDSEEDWDPRNATQNAERMVHERRQRREQAAEAARAAAAERQQRRRRLRRQAVLNSYRTAPDEPLHMDRHALDGRVPCTHCGALNWLDERTGGSKSNPLFSICCGKGKVCGGARHSCGFVEG